MIRAGLTTLAMLLAAPLAAAQSTAPHNRILLLGEHARLDRGLPHWQETGVLVSRHWSVRQVAEAAVVRTRRFGEEDTRIDLGYSTPLSDRLTGTVQASASPTHEVLARHSFGGHLQYEFAPGWLAHGGVRHTRYDEAEVAQARLALEHYSGPFSLLAAWSPARALGEDTQGVELRGNWYYGDASSAGVILARGDEATQLGPGRGVLADVRAVALVGRHSIGPGRWLVWGANRTRQGGFYTRTGATLGLQLAF
jgi:YaiO family outer membrane protein